MIQLFYSNFAKRIAKSKCPGRNHAADIFGKDRKADSGVNEKDLHAKIGHLSMENDFSAIELGHINDDD